MTEAVLDELKSATVLRLEPGDKLVVRLGREAVATDADEVRQLAARWLGIAPEAVIVLAGEADLAVLRKSAAMTPAPVFVQFRNARDQPIAIDRTKVLSVEALGSDPSAGPDAPEYCQVYLAMLDQPLVVRGSEEEVVAAVEGAAAYDPTGLSAVAGPVAAGRITKAMEIVARQAGDWQLWFADPTHEEDRLQRALRELHAAIEGKSPEECAREVLGAAVREQS